MKDKSTKITLKFSPAEMQTALEKYLNSEMFQYGNKVGVTAISYSRKKHERGEYTIKMTMKGK